ncbi:MAG TPA: hypothetical protein DC047_09155 [Blastocatellia bacterium]|nr:hypothetical protein [Blastocatellia bacterium]
MQFLSSKPRLRSLELWVPQLHRSNAHAVTPRLDSIENPTITLNSLWKVPQSLARKLPEKRPSGQEIPAIRTLINRAQGLRLGVRAIGSKPGISLIRSLIEVPKQLA